MVSELVGISPDYLAVVDFAAFEALLGEVGPVTVTSPQSFESHGVVVREGENTFDPGEALAYVRHRLSFVDQDFSRSANQQRLMAAALDAYQSRADDPGFVEAAALAALSVVDTDLTPAALYRLAQAFTAVDTRRLTGCVLPGTPTELPSGASVVFLDEAGCAAHRRRRRGRRRHLPTHVRPVPLVTSAEPGLAGPDDRLRAVRDLQLGEDVARVVADGLDREPEARGRSRRSRVPARSGRGSRARDR